jgi:hypothetical protein
MLMHDFDDEHPYPPSVSEWRAERQAAQARGELGGGPEQWTPAYAHVYIDDGGGVGLDDPVPAPELVEHIVIWDAPTLALGGVFPPADARVLVHAKLLLLAMEIAGLHGSPEKVLVGDPIISLGFKIARATWRITVPELKRATMLDSIAQLRAEASTSGRVNRDMAKRLLGRLTNISQILPELKTFLRGGYRATEAAWARRAGLRAPAAQQLAAGSAAHTEWTQLLEVAEHVLTSNEGIPIAPRKVFRAPSEGAVLCTSDASGDDGFGGYVFIPGGDPSLVYIVSEGWPEWALQARRQNDKRNSEKANSAEAEFSMPAAELFATWAVSEAAISEHHSPSALTSAASNAAVRVRPSNPPIIAIGDCQLAVRVIDAATSGEVTMRAILAGARGLSKSWLGVHVPREANRDADLLSHPDNVLAVMAAARVAGLLPIRARVPRACFDRLHAALHTGALARAASKALAAPAGGPHPAETGPAAAGGDPPTP